MTKEISREEKVKEETALFTAQRVPTQGIIGLGSGTTASAFIIALGKRWRNEKLDIKCVATSTHSEELALREGLVVLPHWKGSIDVTFDGADLVDKEGTAIKGLGGALLREKIVAFHSLRLILMVGERKVVDTPTTFILPVAVVPFGIDATMDSIEQLGFTPLLRRHKNSPFVSDDGHWILDISMNGALGSLKNINDMLRAIPGVVETGLFFKLASEVIIGYGDGRVASMPISCKG